MRLFLENSLKRFFGRGQLRGLYSPCRHQESGKRSLARKWREKRQKHQKKWPKSDRKSSPAKGVWQESDEKSDRSIRKSDQKVTERVPKTKKIKWSNSFADLLLRHPDYPNQIQQLVPQGHKDRITTLPSKNPAETPQSPAETPQSPAETLQNPAETLWEANFLREPRGGLCRSDGDPPELQNQRLRDDTKSKSCTFEGGVERGGREEKCPKTLFLSWEAPWQ